MQLVTLDFETYYDKDYTLKKMGTEEYVRDLRFQVHCLGIKLNNTPAKIAEEDLFRYEIVLSQCAVLCHHAQFDGLILSHHHNIKPFFWFDTLSIARLVFPHWKSHSLESLAKYFNLSPKIVPYEKFMGKRELDPQTQKELEDGCKHDVELTYQIFKKLLPLVPVEELKVIDMTIRMFTEPVLELDKEKVSEHLKVLKQDKIALLASCGVTEEELQSSERFGELLKETGVTPPIKKSNKTSKDLYAFAKTDEGMKGLLNHENEKVQALTKARLSVKSTIDETRSESLLGTAQRGKLPIYLKYYGAHTGRWSGGDGVNWQNFPRGGVIRKSILAPKGYNIVVADLAQIECRVLAWLAGERQVLDSFIQGRDLYCEFASGMYGRTITKEDKRERQIAKSAVLGAGYGMGAEKFRNYCAQSGINITEQEAKQTIDYYRKSNPRIKKLWYSGENLLKTMFIADSFEWEGFIVADKKIFLPNAAWIDYGTLENINNGFLIKKKDIKYHIWGGMVIENVVQALSRVILSQAMLKIAQKYKVINSVHDEIWILAPEYEVENALQFVLDILKCSPVWAIDLPLNAEGFFGENYAK